MEIFQFKFQIQDAAFDGSEILTWNKVLENLEIEKKQKNKSE